LQGHCETNTPFNVIGADAIIPKSSKCKLFQQMPFNDLADREKIRPDVVLLHADKTGQLIAALRQEQDVKIEARIGPAKTRRVKIETQSPVEEAAIRPTLASVQRPLTYG